MNEMKCSTLWKIRTGLLTIFLLVGVILLVGCHASGSGDETAGSGEATHLPGTEPAESVTTPGDETVPSGSDETEGETEMGIPEPDGITRIALLSDSHVGKMNLEVMPEDKLGKALDRVNSLFGRTDAMVMIGDLTDRGYDWEYDIYTKTIMAHIQPQTTLCSIMGNHEYFRDGVVRFGGESPRFVKECQKAYEEHIGPLDTDIVVNGIHIIGVSPRNSAADYRAATDYLVEHVKAAAKEDPNMPIIVYTHEGFGPIYDNGGGTFKTSLEEILTDYPQMIVCSGHTHYPLNDPRLIQQKNFTTIATSTVGADFWNYTGSPSAQPPEAGTASQGILFTMGKDRVVHLQRYDFTHDAPIGQEWVLDIPAIVKSRSAFRYTEEQRLHDAKAPTFPQNEKIRLSDITETGLTVTFPAAHIQDEVSDDAVWYYYISVEEKKSDAARFTKGILADYYMGTAKKTEYTVPVDGLQSGREYRVVIRAKSMWDKFSEDFTVDFKTAGVFSGVIKSENYALHQKPIASGSAYESAEDSWGLANLTDGSKLQKPSDGEGGSNGWMAQGCPDLIPQGDSVWGGVDLGEMRTFNEVDIYPRKSGEYFAPDYDVQISTDGETYETVLSVKDDTKVGGFVRELKLPKDCEARFVRIVARKLVEPYEGGLGGYLMQLSEIEVYMTRPDEES